MKFLADLPARWSNMPMAIVATVALLLLAGIGIILQSEAAYRELQTQETRVQSEILAASVVAALDFEDRASIQAAVDAMRVNRQIRVIGVYDRSGALMVGYGRDNARPPAQFVDPLSPAGAAIVSIAQVTYRGERIGTVYFVSDPEPLSRRLTRYLMISLLVVLSALVIVVLAFGQAALRRANRELKARADALIKANAELEIQVAERGKAEDQLRQSHKMQALGQLTGGIAHDFNNLLTVIQGSADMLRRPGLEESKRVRFADAVVQASARAAALTRQLLAFARRQPLQPEIIDVNELVRDMIDLLDRTLGERIKVETLLASDTCAVEADRAQLESAVLNVAVNARDAMPDGGSLTIRTERVHEGESGTMVALSISDSGAGMDEDTLARAFEPFFTTKATGRGTGLGLSQVYGFASQSGGDVRIESAAGSGTTVTLLLPCSQRTAPIREADEADGTVPHSQGRILVVEDNEEVGDFAESLLRELGHRVTRVRSAQAALEATRAEAFDAVFSDVVMPGMSGLELADQLGREAPDLPVILTTGYSDEIAKTGAGGRQVILKPYRLETLAAAIDQVLR
ncbi:MAG TPA: ATP-binding protein [Allosphingosinicella sp.]|nr:ATP-binding protein [Allosphingosinicella sp.]